MSLAKHIPRRLLCKVFKACEGFLLVKRLWIILIIEVRSQIKTRNLLVSPYKIGNIEI